MRYLFKNFLLEYVPATPLRVFLKDILGTKLAHLAYTQPGRKVALSVRAVARSGISGVQRGVCPFAGAGGRPPVSFSPAPTGGAKKLCNSPALSVQSFDIHDLKLVQSYITAIITVQNATLVAIWLRISR